MDNEQNGTDEAQNRYQIDLGNLLLSVERFPLAGISLRSL
jgi:hypothetical protein